MQTFLCTLAVVLLAAACHAVPAGARSISFQTHSVDDIREWAQLLAKGMNVSKIDLHYLPNVLCSRLPHDKYPPQIWNDSRGCMLFVHDFPQLKNPSYSTILDLFDFIERPQNAHYFQNPDKKFDLALCFKSGGNCNDTNWISLVDDIYARHAALTKKYPYFNTQFVLDGAGSPNKPCLYDKWRPWVSTYIPSQDAKDALFSNDTTYAYDRYQILNPSVDKNDKTKNIRDLQKVHYGKFLNGSYPFLTWEPSNQVEILQVIDAYLDAPVELYNEKGLLFSINIDPKLFEVYAGSRTGNAWNYAVQGSHYKPLTSVLVNGKDITIVTMSSACTSCTETMYGVYTADRPVGELNQVVESKPFSSPLATITSLDSTQWNGDSVFLTSDTISQYAIHVLQKDLSFKLIQNGYFSANGSLSSSSIFTYGNDLLISSATSERDCSLLYTIWQVQGTDIKPRYTECLNAWNPNSVSIDTLSTNDTAYSIVSWSTSSNTIYGCAIQTSFKDGTTTSTCSPVPVSVGSAPKVSLAAIENIVVVLQVQTDSFCFNSLTRNTQAFPSVCDLIPVSESGVLTYTYGAWNAFEQQYSDASLITSCNKRLLHGMYDMGTNPDVSLFVYDDNDFGMVAVHEAITDESAGNMNCGRPLIQTKGTMMIDAFSLQIH